MRELHAAEATIGQIQNVQAMASRYLHWPDLDVDLHIDGLENPDKYPVQSKLAKGCVPLKPPIADATGERCSPAIGYEKEPTALIPSIANRRLKKLLGRIGHRLIVELTERVLRGALLGFFFAAAPGGRIADRADLG